LLSRVLELLVHFLDHSLRAFELAHHHILSGGGGKAHNMS
jgi:hypothetical protein